MESLVVLGIVGALVAVSMPVVVRSRQSADAIVCASNIRQVALAMANYEAQNGIYPARRAWHGVGHASWIDFRHVRERGVNVAYLAGNIELVVLPPTIAPAQFSTIQGPAATAAVAPLMQRPFSDAAFVRSGS